MTKNTIEQRMLAENISMLLNAEPDPKLRTHRLFQALQYAGFQLVVLRKENGIDTVEVVEYKPR